MDVAPSEAGELGEEDYGVYKMLHQEALKKFGNTSFVQRTQALFHLISTLQSLQPSLKLEDSSESDELDMLADVVERVHGQTLSPGGEESKSREKGKHAGFPTALWADGLVRPPLCMASTPYMRRDLVVWGDCVKLRYGSSPASSPWLWQHMKLYVERMASAFHAIRIDNAHGTPLHVAAAMTDVARAVSPSFSATLDRAFTALHPPPSLLPCSFPPLLYCQIRPNIFVCAELFTGRVDQDVLYTTQLGINALVRESLQSSSARELADHIYKHGGEPVASISANDVRS